LRSDYSINLLKLKSFALWCSHFPGNAPLDGLPPSAMSRSAFIAAAVLFCLKRKTVLIQCHMLVFSECSRHARLFAAQILLRWLPVSLVPPNLCDLFVTLKTAND